MKNFFTHLVASAFYAASILTPLHASQNALSAPTTGTVSGLQLVNAYNNGLDSVNTMNSGASAPTNQLSGVAGLGNRWLNTTANPYPANVYDGAQWLAPYYIDAANHLILNQVGGGTSTLASAATTSLCSVPQYFITITGNVTITGLGTGCFVGQAKKVTFSGTPTLTYNAASLIIPGAANVPVSAGDTADVVYLGSGNWQVVNYQPGNGQALINPAIDVGDYVITALTAPPSAKYLFAYGQAVSRSTYATLLSGITITESVSATNGSPTLTGFSDTTQIGAGAAIEAPFIPNGTTIVSCTSSSCLMSGNASTSTTGNVTIFPHGNGCGIGTSCASPSTTFNMPDCRAVTFAGRPNMGGTARSDSYQLTSAYFGANPNALGALGGSQSYTQQRSDLPNVAPTFTGSSSAVSGLPSNIVIAPGFFGGTPGSGGPGDSLNSPTQSSPSLSVTPAGTVQSLNGNVTQTAMPRVQPTLIANCMMRVLAMIKPATHPSIVVGANDNWLIIPDRRRSRIA